MITGYNTDVEYGGIVYHVQTEDKGLQTPIILSLVYSGGAILASKRSPYDDLIAGGFDQAMLVERLQRQHKLICAAINAGRIEDLKRMGERPTGALETATAADAAPVDDAEDKADPEGMAPTQPLQTAGERFSTSDDVGEALTLTLLDEKQMRAGESITLRIEVAKHDEGDARPAGKANITVKVLGSTFQPSSTYSMTDSYGHASISVTLPTFKTGRGAIFIRAESDGEVAELRRVIHPA
ncbi:MAG TPA: hypothetical protein VN696_00125 [Pyrinomonadaceae bacterium]|nr:hypothetical protein [Pyrinomonadaceae bacterium]